MLAYSFRSIVGMSMHLLLDGSREWYEGTYGRGDGEDQDAMDGEAQEQQKYGHHRTSHHTSDDSGGSGTYTEHGVDPDGHGQSIADGDAGEYHGEEVTSAPSHIDT